MKAERNPHATSLKIAIVALQDMVTPSEWRMLGIALADAIAEINRLDEDNDKLARKVKWLEDDRDYWQHKWGNGNG